MQDRTFSEDEVRLLARCAHALMMSADGDKQEAQYFLQYAAAAGDRDSQLSWGLWLARMDIDGKRNDGIAGAANYKEAIRWLAMAGEQGLAKAWYAISRIYLKAEFSQRNLEQVHHYLRKAAEAGYHVAQREFGMLIWRTRKGDASKDVHAAYWLQQAVLQGCGEARAQLMKIASPPVPAAWALEAQQQLTQQSFKVPTVLMARVTLAARFGLSLPETLLIDPAGADLGHCLLVDVRTQYARGRRRLIMIETSEQRQTLDRVAQLLDGMDCGPNGPEGKYRQRLYRFRKLVPNCAVFRNDRTDADASAETD